MDINKGDLIHGFKLINSETIDDVKSQGHYFEHQKTGAKLYYIENNDDNKVFFIGFKTPPSDDCGTPHILEHSVLCGSQKYQSKDPFNQLVKGSLNTFLNAMTYSDKTLYPVASQNSKDFKNLVSVYLDAVFRPLIYNKKEIFMQEGWHYELTDESAPLIYKGVVYNEMKGAFSDPERTLDFEITKSLFPDTIYSYESGGDPSAIPDLTYEKFIDFHKTLYHPSNSYIYLYGDMDICEYLKYLNDEYLNGYYKITPPTDIKLAERSDKHVERTAYYPVSSGEDSNAYMAYSVSAGVCYDFELVMSLELLLYILLETSASPLKKAIIDAGIADNVEGWYDSSVLQPIFSIVAKNVKGDKKEQFESIIKSSLEDIYKNGIDKKLVESSLNYLEFLFREEDYGYRPKGLVYGIKSMKAWLHGKNTMDFMRHLSQIEKIRQKAQNGYFESLIKKYLIDNKHTSTVCVYPKQGLQAELDKKEREKLDNIKSKLSKDEISKLIDDTKNLNIWQSEPDSTEIDEQIPILSVDEIDNKIKYDNSVLIENNYKMLFTDVDTNEIVYADIIFDTSNVPENLINYAGLIVRLIGKIDTEKYDYSELPTEINMNTGGVYGDIRVYSRSSEDFIPKLFVSGKAKSNKLNELFDIFNEVTLKSKFDSEDSIKKIIRELKVRMESDIINNSHTTAVSRCLASFTASGAYKENVKGIAFYKFICEIEEKLDTDLENIIKNIKKTYDLIFTKENAFFALFCGNSEKEKFILLANEFYKKLKSSKNSDIIKAKFTPSKEAFTSASKVQYNAKAGDYKKLGYEYNGAMAVLRTIVNLEYLWNKVRVQGGAYGCGSNILRNGSLYFYSYRDPNISQTLSVYDSTDKFVKNFSASERDMTKYIIGTISSYDRPKNFSERADTVISDYFTGVTYYHRQTEREQILGCKLSDINKLSGIFNQQNICVIGNEDKILENKNIFDKISNLIGK